MHRVISSRRYAPLRRSGWYANSRYSIGAAIAVAVCTSACDTSGRAGISQAELESRERPLRLGDSVAFALCRSADADSTCSWRHVDDVIQLSDGEFLVLNSQSEIFRFSRDGSSLGRFSRSGDGPGELRWIRTIAPIEGGGVTAFDLRNFRISRFDLALALQSTVPVVPSKSWQDIRATGAAVAFLSVGDAPEVGARTVGTVSWIDAESGAVTEAFQFPAVADRLEGTDLRPLPVPFAPRLLWAVSASRTVLLGYGNDSSVRVFDQSGAIVAEVSLHWSGTKLTPLEIDSVRNQLMRPGGRTSAAFGYADRIADLMAALPESHPRFSDLRLSSTGELWIRKSGSENGNARWYLFQQDGHPIGALDLPTSDRLVRVLGDTVVLVRTDDDGRPYVVGYRLLR